LCADEIVFTSGGSEANNHAIKGAFFGWKWRGHHIVTTRIEHPSVTQPCRFLEALGAEVTYLPVDGTGAVDPDDVRQAITNRTILISVMHANNEVRKRICSERSGLRGEAGVTARSIVQSSLPSPASKFFRHDAMAGL